MCIRDRYGIYYRIDQTGSGNGYPRLNSNVSVYYRGTLLDGTVFDERTRAEGPITFSLTRVIQGWQISIPRLQENGVGTFIIPSVYAYGTRSTDDIPRNSVLIFEVELINFN